MTDNEAQYLQGRKAVWLSLLHQAVRELGLEGQTFESLATERADVVRMLRGICAEYGDNNWEDDLHLADVIEKHLYKHLQ